MPYEIFLAFRYLYTRRRRWTTRIATLVAIVGIAFGVAALIVSLALANGFQDEMRQKLLRGTAHITVSRPDGHPITEYRSVIASITKIEGVTGAEATTYAGALLSGSAGSAFAVLRGIDPDSDHAIKDARSSLIAGSIDGILSEPSIPQLGKAGITDSAGMTSFDEAPSEAALPMVIPGAELAERTGLRVGDTAQLLSSEPTLTPLGLAPRYRRVRIGGIFRSGLYEYDATWIYLSLRNASSFSGASEPSASAVSVQVRDIYDSPSIGAKIAARLGTGFNTVDWQEANRPLFSALALERRMAIFVISLIILIAALNITTTIVMVVSERRSDIAILSAMGARAGSVIALFVIEGVCIGVSGAMAGILLGVAACIFGEHFHAVSLPAEVYSVSNVPFHFHTTDLLLSGTVAVALSFIATIYPAFSAARQRPTDVLREA